MNRGLSLISVFVLAVSVSVPVWAERVLLVEGDTRALLATPHRCGQPALVTVESSQPQWFQQDARQLQRLLDGVRAILAFECPTVREIRLEGRLQGMDAVVYRGKATRDSEWWLDTQGSIRSETDAGTAGSGGSLSSSNGFAVAGLDTGMTLEETKAAVQRAFDVTPSYAAARRVLSFESGGCPPGYDPESAVGAPQTGWRCLQGWFSDDTPPRLSRFELIQVTEHESTRAIEDLLEERFGAPGARWLENNRSGGLWGIGREVVHLAWGDVVSTQPTQSGQPRPVYELEAAVDRVEGRTVTVLKRAAKTAEPSPPTAADLKL